MILSYCLNYQVRLEHILERIGLISDAANTEKPSPISSSLFIGGALAARSVYTLQLLGITHILCLCSNEIGQADSQFPELFEYKNFSVSDAHSCCLFIFCENSCTIFVWSHDITFSCSLIFPFESKLFLGHDSVSVNRYATTKTVTSVLSSKKLTTSSTTSKA